MKVLEIELRNAGWSGKASEFRALVTSEYDTFIARHSAGMRVPDFLLRPELAMQFADLVRHRLRSSRLQDHTILGSLAGRAA